MNVTSTAFALRSRRVVLPDGMCAATIVVENEVIRDILPHDATSSSIPLVDVGDLVLSPGVIDAHVHVNEPGRSDWEGFLTATRAAAAGGVTTLVDMPLNSSPVTTTPSALAAKRDAARGKCWTDVGFYGGLVPGSAGHIESLCDEGVLGIKAFLCHSGLDEFPNATEQDLREAMPILARRGVPLLVHAELLTSPAPAIENVRSHFQYAVSRPATWELDAIELLIRLCREYRCPVHIVHLATGHALPMLSQAKRNGLPVTIETCPHYLFFDETEIADGDTRFKCAPPIRLSEGAKLWRGLSDGTIDTIGSDHSPCLPTMKCQAEGDFTKAWGGIASLQLTLSSVWSYCLRRGMDDPWQLSQWLSEAPARLVRMNSRKGRIAAGYDADIVVWDPAATWRVDGQKLHHRHPLTPYDGMEMTGRVERTYVRSHLVFCDGMHVESPLGAFVAR